MSDQNLIEALLSSKLNQVIEQEVAEVVKNKDWIGHLESQIVAYTQDRLATKFNNIATVPGLVEAVKLGVKDLFDNGSVPGIESYVNPATIQSVVDQGIQNLVESIIDQLVVDQLWLKKIQTIVDRRMADRVQTAISQLDLADAIDQSVIKNFGTQVDAIKKDLIVPGLLVNNHQTSVVNDLVANKNLTINGDLIVRGRINTDSPAWQALVTSASTQAKTQLVSEYSDTIVQKTLNVIQNQGIEADKILIEGNPVLAGQTLLPGVQNSSLTTVGELQTLVVRGSATLSGCAYIGNNRVGVNTDSPDAALSVWDEEATVSIGKLKQDTAYIGTNRRQNFAITINRQSQLEISADGITTIQKLQVGKHKISHSNEEPGWLGNKGDFVINNEMEVRLLGFV